MEWFSKNKGYTLTQKHLRTPFTTRDKFLDNLWEGITKKTKIIFISHITSPTAIIFPVEEICHRARNEGILTIIDGAHVPGHIQLDISALDPDIYIGACHKWLSAPKGSSFMYVKKDGFQSPHIHNVSDKTLIVFVYFSKNWEDGDPGGTYLSDGNDESKIIFEPSGENCGFSSFPA